MQRLQIFQHGKRVQSVLVRPNSLLLHQQQRRSFHSKGNRLSFMLREGRKTSAAMQRTKVEIRKVRKNKYMRELEREMNEEDARDEERLEKELAESRVERKREKLERRARRGARVKTFLYIVIFAAVNAVLIAWIWMMKNNPSLGRNELVDKLFKSINSSGVITVSRSVGDWLEAVVIPMAKKFEQWFRFVDKEDDYFNTPYTSTDSIRSAAQQGAVDADRFKEQISKKIGGIVSARKDEVTQEKGTAETLHDMLDRLSRQSRSQLSRR